MAAGVADSLIRLSAGLEDTEDLIDDLRKTLDNIKDHQYNHNIINGNA